MSRSVSTVLFHGQHFGHGIVQCSPTLTSIQDLFQPKLWQTAVDAVAVYSAPEDGRKGRPKHVEHTCKFYKTQYCQSCILFVYNTGCHRRNGPNFRRVFLMWNYTDITQNTYIQSWTVTEIMASEVWNFDICYTLTDYQIHTETGRNMWFL